MFSHESSSGAGAPAVDAEQLRCIVYKEAPLVSGELGYLYPG